VFLVTYLSVGIALAEDGARALFYEMSVVLLDVLDDQSQLFVVKVLIDRKYSFWKERISPPKALG